MPQARDNRSRFTFIFVAFAFGMLISALIMQQTTPPLEDSKTLLTYEGVDYGLEDLPGGPANQYAEVSNRLADEQKVILEDAALQLFIADRAKKDNKTFAQMEQELLAPAPVTEEQISAFYEANQTQLNQPFFQIKDRIADYLRQQALQKQRHKLVHQLMDDGRVMLHITRPGSPKVDILTQGFPRKGPATAPVQIVEFADYQCPHCKAASDTLRAVATDLGDQVAITFMDFPVNRSGISRKIAEGAVCADQQGAFWTYHDLAFAEQDKLQASSPADFAERLNLDLAVFSACLEDPATAAKVKSSEKQAVDLGIRGTPAIYINGRKYTEGNLGPDLKKAIEEALSAAG